MIPQVSPTAVDILNAVVAGDIDYERLENSWALEYIDVSVEQLRKFLSDAAHAPGMEQVMEHFDRWSHALYNTDTHWDETTHRRLETVDEPSEFERQETAGEDPAFDETTEREPNRDEFNGEEEAAAKDYGDE